MSQIEDKLGDLLEEINDDELLTPSVIEQLAPLADQDLSVLANMSRLALSKLIRDKAGRSVERRLDVAKRIHQLIKETSDDDQPQGGNPPAGPTEFILKQEKTPDQYNLQELLAALAENPARHGELMPHLKANSQYSQAARKSVSLGVPTANGGLDAVATAEYIVILSRQHTHPQRTVKDRRPVPLEKLLGLEMRSLMRPFTMEPVQGPDQNGFDWGALSEELHKAVLWAQATHHHAWPGSSDIFQHSMELFSTPLNPRWQVILEDYRAACQEDENAIVTSRYHTPESERKYHEITGGSQQASAIRSDGSPGRPSYGSVETHQQPPKRDYKQELEELADRSGNLDFSGSMSQSQGGVYAMVNFSASMGKLGEGTVVMRGGRVSGSMSSGIIYAPVGVNISISGSMSSVRVVHKSYAELAKIAGLVD